MTAPRDARPVVAPGLPLAEYGLIGDCRTAALVSRSGSLDWWCPGRFDHPSVFARLLDWERGGTWALEAPGAQATMAYVPGTNVLQRTLRAGGAEAVVHEFMPWPPDAGEAAGALVVRTAEGVRGRVPLRLVFDPRPDYARIEPALTAQGTRGVARWGGEGLALVSDLPLRVAAGRLEAEGEVGAGERLAFLARHTPAGIAPTSLDTAVAWPLLEGTLAAWRRWDARTRPEGPYAGAVRRSSLLLKLLQHEPTGGIVAAPTTSLPESLGGVRNWDYRFVWIRDAWLLAEALFLVGHPTQADALLRWLTEACQRSAPALRVLYGLTPGSAGEEHELPHLAGWRGSKPVRVGNAARDQFQLDVYGEFVGALWRCQMLGRDAVAEAWPFVRDVVDLVAQRWKEPDNGIWEFRAAPRHFVHSKVMAWVALDRGARAVRELGLPGPGSRWERERDHVREEVLTLGWSEARQAFVQSYGSDALDAATLLMPHVGFLPAKDPRMVATVQRVQAELAQGPWVRRYRADDGLPGDEGAFLYCSFWLADNLAMQGRVEEARAILDGLLRVGGPLGLLPEMADPATGEALGNYPQGFSHIGLVRSALLLAELEGRAQPAVPPSMRTP